MSKGLFVQCHGCGFIGFIDLEGGFDARERQINRMIDEGWRLAAAWGNFVCPTCVRAGGTPYALFRQLVPQPRIANRLHTYVELRDRADNQLAAFEACGLMEEGRR